MREPRLLFGIGATKAGTSWLHSWLSAHPGCHFRRVKELHWFDALEEGTLPRQVEEVRAERDRILARGGRGAAERVADHDALLALYERPGDHAAYLDYVTAGAEGRLSADVTPAYGLLSEARLAEMAALGDTRFVYILRDPVERLWSHVRMIAMRRGGVEGFAGRAGRILRRTLRGRESEIARRSDYRGAMIRLAAAVPAERSHVAFAEDLFAGRTAAELCEFLGLRARPVPGRPVHQGRPLPMTPEQSAAAREWLAEQYDFVAQAMGRVPDAWRQDERV